MTTHPGSILPLPLSASWSFSRKLMFRSQFVCEIWILPAPYHRATQVETLEYQLAHTRTGMILSRDFYNHDNLKYEVVIVCYLTQKLIDGFIKEKTTTKTIQTNRQKKNFGLKTCSRVFFVCFCLMFVCLFCLFSLSHSSMQQTLKVAFTLTGWSYHCTSFISSASDHFLLCYVC